MFQWSKEDGIVLPLMLVGMIGITVLLWFLLRKKEEKYRKIPLMVITIIILVLEVIKQIKNAVDGTYSTWTIPLHFCSLFLYFFPLAVFCKGKVGQFGKVMSFVTSLWLFALFYIRPDTIINNSAANPFASFGMFHTFIYHHLALLFFMVSVALKFYDIKYKDFIYVVIGFTIYAAIGLTVAHLTGTNYCNMLQNNFEPLENFRLQFGQVPYTILMYLGGVAGGIAGCLIYIGFDKLFKFVKNKKTKEKNE